MNRTFPELPAETEDFRTGNAIHSRFRDILLISVLSVICSMDTSAETAMFADHQRNIWLWCLRVCSFRKRLPCGILSASGIFPGLPV
ncbi:MAG: hypothetical protein SOV63_11665 [Pyramidobacter porci]|uniref:hypothetical protein n=1 Tax=Pyramidobacter porci TaxID=2605789 RepID=UPI002A75CACE|nr:hypothetical protein [Pyramidobacter porci]MDY2649450.1 hypothetical protein [Pyramidobacter porci]